jgi:hypothetical protein
MNDERPTTGFFACGAKVAREIEAALRLKEIDKVARPLIESAAGVLEGDQNGPGI